MPNITSVSSLPPLRNQEDRVTWKIRGKLKVSNIWPHEPLLFLFAFQSYERWLLTEELQQGGGYSGARGAWGDLWGAGSQIRASSSVLRLLSSKQAATRPSFQQTNPILERNKFVWPKKNSLRLLSSPFSIQRSIKMRIQLLVFTVSMAAFCFW